jgi:hypothetical protein
MTREEKIKLLIERGYTCNPQTGEVFGSKGNVIRSKSSSSYLVIRLRNNEKGYVLYSHQFIWYWVNKEIVDCIDHINGIKNDNRISNLRSVTQQQNLFNRKFKGYSWNKNSNKYQSRIMIDGKNIYLGYYNTEQEAKEVYLKAKEKHHQI